MDYEVEKYIEKQSGILNANLRGLVNLKGHDENLELIKITLIQVFNDTVIWCNNKNKDNKKDDDEHNS